MNVQIVEIFTVDLGVTGHEMKIGTKNRQMAQTIFMLYDTFFCMALKMVETKQVKYINANVFLLSHSL